MSIPKNQHCRHIQALPRGRSCCLTLKSIDLNLALIYFYYAVQVKANEIDWKQELDLAKVLSTYYKPINSLQKNLTLLLTILTCKSHNR